ncbi:MAG: FMN-binding protein [Proteobacteria bacterium]|jgi:Na+-translocating ferredoxin:NAD+ oxidoreductase subunit G|nr:FMN-binding protein [Pseudomonadota bacterium]
MSEEAAPVADFTEPEPSSLRLIFTLGIAGFFAGCVIVGIFEFTKPYIETHRENDLNKAVFEVVPDSTLKQEIVFENEAFGFRTAQTKKDAPKIYEAFDADKNFKGYAIEAKGNGFQDTIELIYGYNPAKKQIVGMKVLTHLETPGLGDKIVKDQTFIDNFDALSVEPEVVGVKTGTKANEVDCITGATISSKAIISIINKSTGDWLSRLPESGHEMNYQAQEPATAPQEEE